VLEVGAGSLSNAVRRHKQKNGDCFTVGYRFAQMNRTKQNLSVTSSATSGIMTNLYDGPQ
jgi:hypothetical protein